MTTSPFTIRVRVPVLALTVAGLVLYGLAHWQGTSGSENQQVIREARQALKTHKAYQTRQDSLRDETVDRIRTVHIRDTVIVRLDAELVTDTSARDSVETLLSERDTLIAQRDSLASALRILGFHDALSNGRVVELEANLRASLKVTECHILGLGFMPKCPSRTASFLVGAGGASLALLLVRH